MCRSRELAVGVCLSLVSFGLARAADDKADEKETKEIRVGQTAPDFTLKDHDGKEVKLLDLCKVKKKNVLLAFYPKDFTGG